MKNRKNYEGVIALEKHPKEAVVRRNKPVHGHKHEDTLLLNDIDEALDYLPIERFKNGSYETLLLAQEKISEIARRNTVMLEKALNSKFSHMIREVNVEYLCKFKKATKFNINNVVSATVKGVGKITLDGNGFDVKVKLLEYVKSKTPMIIKLRMAGFEVEVGIYQ